METLLIGAGAFLAGVAMLALGYARRGRAAAMRGVPLRFAAELNPAERQFVSGKARSPVKLTAPLSRQDCAFYHEIVEQYHVSMGSGRRGMARGSWERVADHFYGAFYVDDPTGSVLVVPTYDSLDLAKPGLQFDDSPESRRYERTILQGETVCALGVPRSVGELVGYLRQSNSANLPGDLVAELMRLEADPASSGLACFFGRGLERLADRPCGEYVTGTGESAAGLLRAGWPVALAGAGLTLYALKKLLWQPVSIE